MRANSRNSFRWRVATAVLALVFAALPLAALADGGGNGRLVAFYAKAPNDAAAGGEETVRPLSGLVDDAKASAASQNPGHADDGTWIADDSDVASVDGSVNDDDTADADGFDTTF
jgi:hypothetical protein